MNSGETGRNVCVCVQERKRRKTNREQMNEIRQNNFEVQKRKKRRSAIVQKKGAKKQTIKKMADRMPGK